MATKTNDIDLKEILKDISTGKLQLPEFQRSWVWDDSRILKLLESLISGFPMGAIMNLEHGGDSINFMRRLFTGVEDEYKTVEPNGLILDGQQRLTTLYQTLFSKKPVKTCLPTNRDREIERYYYINLMKIVKDDADVLDCLLSLPSDKKIKENIGREISLDLSTRQKEIEQLYFPVNLIYSPIDTNLWQIDYLKYYATDAEKSNMYFEFMLKVLNPLQNYKLPVIQLTKDTSREAVCQIFENVNTGGIPLTVFELVTAIYAAGYKDKHLNLREDWQNIKKSFAELNVNLLKHLEPHYFLMAMSLLVTYKKSLQSGSAVSCKKRDVLRLHLLDYLDNRDAMVCGFEKASNFLSHHGIFSIRDIPYETQLIPLAAIFAYDENNGKVLNQPNAIELLSKWYWCGVFGELYGGANETRFATDIVGVFRWISGGEEPETVTRSTFHATRILSLRTRNSAAYKGVMALLTMDIPLDFMTGNQMHIASYLDEATDIHHIYPEVKCVNKYPIGKWNSVINKTPIYASTNRSIGGRFPSEYIRTMSNKGLSDEQIVNILESHKINCELLQSDDFDAFVNDRATRILDRIEIAMGKTVSGRDSEETIKEFGQSV